MTAWQGKVVWVVGASSGIGRETASLLAAEGAHVVASARSADSLNSFAKEDPSGERITPLSLDVSDRDAAIAAAEKIRKDHGAIDLMIFSAALWDQTPLDKITDEAFRSTFEVNVFGALHVLEAVMPAMIDRGTGHLAIISSVAGFRGLPNAAAYGASKAALTHLAEAIHPEATRKGLKVQVVHPGFVETPLTSKNTFKMPFIITAEKAARRIVNGLSKTGFEITFPRRFTYQLKLLRILPYRLYLGITGKMV